MIEFSVDPSALRAALQGIAGRELREAAAKALNAGANAVQAAQRAAIDARFTVAPAKRAFIHRLVKIAREDRATPDRLEATVRVAGPENRESLGQLLLRHEEGGTHERTTATAAPWTAFFIPADYLRPSDTSLPDRTLYPSALGFTAMRQVDGSTRIRAARQTRAGGTMYRGKRDTWLVPIGNRQGRTPGIYQRTGEDRGDVQLLWLLVPSIRLGRRLGFRETAEHEVTSTVPGLLVAEFRRAFGVSTS